MLIFNADDFGLTDTDSKRILDSFEKGIVKSTTIVANFVKERDLKRLQQFKDVSTGLHFNLVEGKALGSYKTLTINNEFLPKKQFLKKLFLNLINESEIEKELSLQIEYLLNNGIEISHIDSHQNMHYLPSLLKIIIKVAKQYNIDRIRGLDSEYFWFKDYSKSRAFIKNSISNIFNNKELKKIKHSQKIILNAPGLGFECYSIEEAIKLWDRGLKLNYNPNIIYEVPCHLYLSEFEYKLYNSKEFLDILNKHKVKIGSFNDV